MVPCRDRPNLIERGQIDFGLIVDGESSRAVVEATLPSPLAQRWAGVLCQLQGLGREPRPGRRVNPAPQWIEMILSIPGHSPRIVGRVIPGAGTAGAVAAAV
jgi:hypothetical protein